ncbi:hypothetical protein B484DRAFT_391032 [Ochromonadaceae sp. CCMP2298]|nr:hypothetical protein B484DRAFT_391032 [Ochromonadaceae sp. CCMP2298]
MFNIAQGTKIRRTVADKTKGLKKAKGETAKRETTRTSMFVTPEKAKPLVKEPSKQKKKLTKITLTMQDQSLVEAAEGVAKKRKNSMQGKRKGKTTPSMKVFSEGRALVQAEEEEGKYKTDHKPSEDDEPSVYEGVGYVDEEAEEEVEEEETEDGEEEDEEESIAMADKEGSAIDKEVTVIDEKDAAIDEDLLDNYLNDSVIKVTAAAVERRRTTSTEFPGNTVFITKIKSRKEVLLAIAAWGQTYGFMSFLNDLLGKAMYNLNDMNCMGKAGNRSTYWFGNFGAQAMGKTMLDVKADLLKIYAEQFDRSGKRAKKVAVQFLDDFILDTKNKV